MKHEPMQSPPGGGTRMHVTCTNHITAGARQELAGGKADQGDEEEPEPRCVHICRNRAFLLLLLLLLKRISNDKLRTRLAVFM